MPQIQCPKCNHTLNIPDQYRGQTGQCKHCQTPIYVPTLEEENNLNTPAIPIQPKIGEQMTSADLENLDIDVDAPPPKYNPILVESEQEDDYQGLIKLGWFTYFGSMILLGICMPTLINAVHLPLSICIVIISSLVPMRHLHYTTDKTQEHIKWLIALLLFWIIAYPAYLISRSQNSRLIQTGVVFSSACFAIVLFFVSAGVTFIIYTAPDSPKATPAATVRTRPRIPQRSTYIHQRNYGITLAKFNQIQQGMSYEQVVAILGRNGEMMSESIIGEGTQFETYTVMYQWSTAGIGNMNAMFQNGRMIQKAQFGLQ